MSRALFAIGRAVAGVLVAALATGATLILLAEFTGLLLGVDSAFQSHPSALESLERQSLPVRALAASLGCLLVALPCAILTGVVVSVTAMLKGPAALVAIVAGGILGCIAGIMFVAVGRSSNPEFDAFVLCPITGAMMGLVYWLIAVGPKRAASDLAKLPAA